MRQRGQQRPADELLQDAAPLDEAEQDAILQDLADQQLASARTYLLVFGGGAAASAAFLLYAAYQQHADPWMVRYTGELRTVVSKPGSEACLLVQGAAMAAAAGCLLASVPARGQHRRSCDPGGTRARFALWLALLAACGGAAFWGLALRRSVVRYGWERGWLPHLLWLPLGPPVCCALCLHVVHSLASTGAQLQQLQRLRYSFKSV